MSNNRARTGYLVGLGLIGLGAIIGLKGGFRHLGHLVDFSGYHLQVGVVLIIMGVFFLYTTFRNPRK